MYLHQVLIVIAAMSMSVLGQISQVIVTPACSSSGCSCGISGGGTGVHIIEQFCGFEWGGLHGDTVIGCNCNCVASNLVVTTDYVECPGNCRNLPGQDCVIGSEAIRGEPILCLPPGVAERNPSMNTVGSSRTIDCSKII